MSSAINLAIIVADQAKVTEQEYTYLNMAAILVAMYILVSVSSSQCMGLLGSGFNNLKSARTMLARRFLALPYAHPPLDALPYITQQTVAYALSLVISCVCYSVNDPMTKGRAAQVYEKILANYSKLSAKEFQNVLLAGLTDWVAKVTAPEPAGPEVPVMSLKRPNTAVGQTSAPNHALTGRSSFSDKLYVNINLCNSHILTQ